MQRIQKADNNARTKLCFVIRIHNIKKLKDKIRYYKFWIEILFAFFNAERCILFPIMLWHSLQAYKR